MDEVTSADDVTEAINRAVEEIGEGIDPFVAVAARRILEKTEWRSPDEGQD